MIIEKEFALGLAGFMIAVVTAFLAPIIKLLLELRDSSKEHSLKLDNDREDIKEIKENLKKILGLIYKPRFKTTIPPDEGD